DGGLKRVRELKDPTSTRLREGDALAAALAGTTRDRLALFSSQGTVYVIRVAEEPATTGYGEPVQSLLKFGDGERVVAARLLREEAPTAGGGGGAGGLAGFGARPDRVGQPGLLRGAGRGFGFRDTPDLAETTRAGRRMARVGEGDAVVSVTPVTGTAVVVATGRGKMLRFALEEVTELSGPGRGVTLMKPDADDAVVGALALGRKAKFTVVMAEGAERTMTPDEVPAAHRGGKGQRVIKRGKVAGLAAAGGS